MKFLKVGLIAAALMLALVGCLTSGLGAQSSGSTATPMQTQVGKGSPTPAVTATRTLEPTMAPPPSISPASQAVSRFLQSLQDDNSGAHSIVYLAQSLRDISDNAPVASVLGIQSMYKSFEVTTLAGGTTGGNSLVKATLEYSSPVERLFTLTEQNGTWLIVDIQASEDGLPYPTDPAGVVAAFLNAYRQHADAPDSLRYLSNSRRANVSPSGYGAMLGAKGAITGVGTSAARIESGRAYVTATLTVAGKAEERVFTLTYERNNWRIDAVTTPR